MTASRLGVTVGVSESPRSCALRPSLGYDGYPHLQRALQEMIRNKLTSVQRMEVCGRPAWAAAMCCAPCCTRIRT